MKEELLYYIWQSKSFNYKSLKTTEGESLNLISHGHLNHDSGPDFFNARLEIDGVHWAGNVEIHVKSSDWEKHQHQSDQVYDKVILHVVWENDKTILRKSGQVIPCLELKGRVPKSIIEQYEKLMTSETWIPCQEALRDASQSDISKQLEGCMKARIENKAKQLKNLLMLNQKDWEATLYQQMAKYFGLKVNNLPFELLARSLPFKVIRKYQNNLMQMEALFFGQAGFLEQNFRGNYPLSLQEEFKFLKQKHQLRPIDKSLWKFMRMRPSNFPTIRIAQFAALWHRPYGLFQEFAKADSIDEQRALFNVKTSDYWISHFQFDKPAAKKMVKHLGRGASDILLINVILPLHYLYLLEKGEDTNLILSHYTKLKAENNSIIRKWKSLGLECKTAYDSQALLQLKQYNCDLKKCLSCKVGNSILKSKQDD